MRSSSSRRRLRSTVSDARRSARNRLWLAVVTVLAALAAGFTLAGRGLLPDNYSFDEQKIQRIAQGVESYPGDPSFQRVGDIYRALGLANSSTGAAVLGLIVFFFAVYLAFGALRIEAPLSAGMLVVLGVTVVLGTVYMAHYSKDIFTALLVTIPLLLTRRLKVVGEVTVVTSVAAYAMLFRNYWWLVLAVYLGQRVLVRFGPRLLSFRRYVAYAMTVLLAIAVLLPMVGGVSVEHYRESVNALEVRSSTGSRIDTLIDGSGPASSFLNLLAIHLNIQFPLTLALAGGVFYLGIAIVVSVLWFRLYRSAFGRTKGMPDMEVGVARAASMLFAFSLVQSVFEPDYGSAVRHLAPLLPLALLVVSDFGRQLHSNHRVGSDINSKEVLTP